MAKRRSEAVAELPGYPVEPEEKTEERTAEGADSTERNGVEERRLVGITMPVELGAEGEHKSDHLELRLNSARQIEALHRLWKGCERENVRLAGGGRVVTRADVVRLLLERAAEQMGVD